MLIKQILEKKHSLISVVFSDPGKTSLYDRIRLRPVEERESYWQAERFKDGKVFHLNLTDGEVLKFLEEAVGSFRQACATFEGETLQAFFYGKRPKIKRTQNSLSVCQRGHNKKKNYILSEGEDIPPLVDLGVFTKERRIAKDRYDKYKQINRFIEIVDDAVGGEKRLTVADFGCGKSYLTFLLYYYLTKKKGIEVDVTGYDLKSDVVESCNRTAKKYGYDGLSFKCGNVAKESIKPETDMMVTLHACDTATDYAIATAIKSGVKYLFSVPCCQHEINSCISKGGDFDLMLKYGLIKERFSALLTDTLRAEVLEDFGYKTDVIEFVDLEHSPKNIMLRAVKTSKAAKSKGKGLLELCERYGVRQTLLDLMYK